ncbi:MAG: UbiA family prenyltransferase [Limnochordaceae bacterium]|nr:UbiA family prenyltransferase [Limnochordaceae bacterium]
MPRKPAALAFPLVYAAAILADGAVPPARQLLWLTLAAIGACAAATAINRIVDADVDRVERPSAGGSTASPRPMGSGQALLVALSGTLLLLVAAGQLNTLALWLSPIPVLAFVVVPHTRRWTWAYHAFLGLAQATGPAGGWVAIRAAVEGPAWLLGLAAGLWVSGLDLLLAPPDDAGDREQEIASLPRHPGPRGAMAVARWAHAAAVLAWVMAGWATGRAGWYFGGVALSALLLAWQHARLTLSLPHVSRPRRAWSPGGSVSLVMLAATVLDVHFYG